MTVRPGDKQWAFDAAAIDDVRAAGMEMAAGRRIDRTWHLAV